MRGLSIVLFWLLSGAAALPALAQNTLAHSDILKMEPAGSGEGSSAVFPASEATKPMVASRTRPELLDAIPLYATWMDKYGTGHFAPTEHSGPIPAAARGVFMKKLFADGKSLVVYRF